jgi:hypothetical protein
MKLYDVEGHSRPLRLSEQHAEALGATEHVAPTQAPTKRASRAAWVEYATAQGADPTALDAMTRAEIIERYGD